MPETEDLAHSAAEPPASIAMLSEQSERAPTILDPDVLLKALRARHDEGDAEHEQDDSLFSDDSRSAAPTTMATPKGRHAPQGMVFDTAKRQAPRTIPKKPGYLGSVEYSRQRERQEREHAGRIEGGSEMVLRPVAKAAPTADALEIARKRGELFLAGRLARDALSRLTTTPDRSVATELARDRCRLVAMHIAAAGKLRPEDGSGLRLAYEDAWATSTLLVEQINARKLDSSEATALIRTVRSAAPPEWIPEGSAAVAAAAAHRDDEDASLALAVTAPLMQAALLLDDASDRFREHLTNPTSKGNSDDIKGPRFFIPTADLVAPLLHRCYLSLTHSPSLANAQIRQAADHCATSAQRFLNWATSGTSVPQAVEKVLLAMKPVTSILGMSPVAAAAALRADETQRVNNMTTQLRDIWIKIFDARLGAVKELELAIAPEEPVPFEKQLFATVVKLSLATLIGGVAGTAGALVSEGITHKILASTFANATEEFVGQTAEMIMAKVPDKITDARKAFFHSQHLALQDVKTEYLNTVVASQIVEATRHPDGAAMLAALMAAQEAKAAQIAGAHAAAAVQDWATFRAQIAHNPVVKGSTVAAGTPDAVDMAGVGQGVQIKAGDHQVATGVLALFLDANTKRIYQASAGGLRSDDAARLTGVKLRNITMPVQFSVHALSGGDPLSFLNAAFVVSRSNDGTLYLRDADREYAFDALRMLGGGGDPLSDRDLLAAFSALLPHLQNAVLPKVEVW